jgi:hypothetical protein
VSDDELQFLLVDTVTCRQKLDGCADLANAEYRDSFYAKPNSHLSVACLPETGQEYGKVCSKVVRENANRARRSGYVVQVIDRKDWADDLFELRSSATVRQGRPMPPAYMAYQEYGTDYPYQACPRHGAKVHGVIGPDGHLAGYVQLIQSGDVVRVNTILGHADKLADRVMWLLMLEAVKWHIEHAAAQFLLYYTHYSGTDGLRYWKERFGMRPSTVRWLLP